MAVNLTSGACCPSSAGIRWGLRREIPGTNGQSPKMLHLTRFKRFDFVLSHEMYPFNLYTVHRYTTQNYKAGLCDDPGITAPRGFH